MHSVERFGACVVVSAVLLAPIAAAPRHQQEQPTHAVIAPVALQPLAQHVRRLETALAYLGQPLTAADHARLNDAVGEADEERAIAGIEAALDSYVLLDVTINPESRVSVTQGHARPSLVEGGSRLFLIRLRNLAGTTAPIRVTSPNAGSVSIGSWTSGGAPDPAVTIKPSDVTSRWADFTLYDKPPMSAKLSGLGLEYAILDVYSRDRGQRAADIGVDVGQGSADVGFRNQVSIVFTAAPAFNVRFHVRDELGRPSIASFTITDAFGRVYPATAKRLAPDLPFQSQVYRGDDEDLDLPAGRYDIAWTAGPEYQSGRTTLEVGPSHASEVTVQLHRWIDPARLGWFSGDHHVHAAGCSHYQDPTLGVNPEDMFRQVRGEALNIGAVLTWGPCYYHQKQFFSGSDHPLSTADRLLHYDVEVSGFPSSPAGHLVLLGLKDQDYPGTKRLEDWPTWDLPILRWARAQGAVVGFAHSGWGLESKATDVPNDEVPAFDGIGANEYIVDVTEPNAVNFISTVDTPWPWELNIWYHTLNVGFRTRISGETDFPCITDERVGAGRTYTKLDRLSYRGWADAIERGAAYVSDGRTHLMNFAVNGTAVGTANSEVALPAAGGSAHVTVSAAALLDATPDSRMATRPWDEKPYWSVERARVGVSRDVAVEVVVNGRVAARTTTPADGQIRPLTFEVPIARSSWIAVRVPGAAHTNPMFAMVGGAPIRASRASAAWCLAGVNQCWTQKARNIRDSERDEARHAYDRAREVYKTLAAESTEP
jgi:hypothetical protein